MTGEERGREKVVILPERVTVVTGTYADGLSVLKIANAALTSMKKQGYTEGTIAFDNQDTGAILTLHGPRTHTETFLATLRQQKIPFTIRANGTEYQDLFQRKK